jgi:hypothetical protein
LIASVVDRNGIVQIGDTLYKISEQRTLKVHIRYKDEIVLANSIHVSSKNVIHRELRVGVPKNGKVSGDYDFGTIEYQPSGLSKRRFQITGWSTNYWFPFNYWSTGVTVKHQRKNQAA